MRLEKITWTPDTFWQPEGRVELGSSAQLVLAFGETEFLENEQLYAELRERYPDAHIVGCSAGGAVLDDRVLDDTLVAAAILFEGTAVRIARTTYKDSGDGFAVGQRLAEGLGARGLAHLFVLADGLHMNVSEMVRGLREHVPEEVTITGGLAADGERFERTPLWADGLIIEPGAVAIGFYGNRLKVGYGTLGGWDPFGPDRVVTRSEGNVLYELDDRSALELYKKYLGPYAEQLPASGLLFPLGLRTENGRPEIVRSVIGIDEANQSIIFAGDVPQGTYARFMRTNKERIIDGAVGAARASRWNGTGRPPELALLTSCYGRRQVLGQRTEEEIEGVRGELDPTTEIVGFYAYGEIAPGPRSARCEMHNQTMTLTTFLEL